MAREKRCLSKQCLSFANKCLQKKQQETVVIEGTEAAQKDDKPCRKNI